MLSLLCIVDFCFFTKYIQVVPDTAQCNAQASLGMCFVASCLQPVWSCRNLNERPFRLWSLLVYIPSPCALSGACTWQCDLKGPVEAEHFLSALWMEFFLLWENEHPDSAAQQGQRRIVQVRRNRRSLSFQQQTLPDVLNADEINVTLFVVML